MKKNNMSLNCVAGMFAGTFMLMIAGAPVFAQETNPIPMENQMVNVEENTNVLQESDIVYTDQVNEPQVPNEETVTPETDINQVNKNEDGLGDLTRIPVFNFSEPENNIIVPQEPDVPDEVKDIINDTPSKIISNNDFLVPNINNDVPDDQHKNVIEKSIVPESITDPADSEMNPSVIIGYQKLLKDKNSSNRELENEINNIVDKILDTPKNELGKVIDYEVDDTISKVDYPDENKLLKDVVKDVVGDPLNLIPGYSIIRNGQKEGNESEDSINEVKEADGFVETTAAVGKVVDKTTNIVLDFVPGGGILKRAKNVVIHTGEYLVKKVKNWFF